DEPEGNGREDHGQQEADPVTLERRVVADVVVVVVVGGAHAMLPIRYTKVKTPIHTTSRKCQNIDRHTRRRLFSRVSPSLPTCSISVTSQMQPKVTCRPCVPTSVKKLERKALRCGPAPS